MINIKANTLDELYKKCLQAIMADGRQTYPRGFSCRELSPCSITLVDVQQNILTNPVRQASKTFMAAELLWILMGRDDVAMISYYLPAMAAYSDDGVTFFGAYGPKIKKQLPYVLEALQTDPWTRQAIMTIWRESPKNTRDFPCTISLQFIRRPLSKLNLIVYMRSQDCWLGLPYDVHNFTCIQLLVASILDLEPGEFTLVQGSLHAYERDFSKIEGAINVRDTSEAYTPLSTVTTYERYIQEFFITHCAEFSIRVDDKICSQLPDDPLLRQKIEWLITFWKRRLR